MAAKKTKNIYTLKSFKNEKSEIDNIQNNDILDVERRINDVELALNNMKEWNEGFKETKTKVHEIVGKTNEIEGKTNEIEGKVDKFYSNFLTIIITLIGLGSSFTLVYSTVVTIIPSLSDFLINNQVELKSIILTYLLFINAVVMLTIISFYIIMLLMNNMIYISSNNRKIDMGMLKHISIIFGFFVLVFAFEYIFINLNL